MQAAARDGDGHGVAEADARFHGRIVELADNATLVRVWRSLEPFSRTYITLVVPGADPQWSADLHAPILAALERRDADAVVAALERHFEEVSDEHGPAAGRTSTPKHRGEPCMTETLQPRPRRCRRARPGSASTSRVGEPCEHVLDDMSFLNYRLAEVRIAPAVTLPEPDIVWRRDGEKGSPTTGGG